MGTPPGGTLDSNGALRRFRDNRVIINKDKRPIVQVYRVSPVHQTVISRRFVAVLADIAPRSWH